MDKSALILLIQANEADEYLRQVLVAGESRYRVQTVEHVPMALARIGGGGVDLVILDLSLSTQPEMESLDSFLKLRGNAPQVPVVVVCGSEDDTLGMRAVRAGAVDYLPRAKWNTELRALAQSVIGRRPMQLEPRPRLVPEPRQAGALTTFLGAKGGVGTTTVALNVASLLAKWGKVILTELRPALGTLSRYFRPHHLTGNNARLLQADNGTITRAQVEAALWPYRGIPGLNVLFGPQTIEQNREVAAHSAEAVVKVLSQLADYVVVDLPPSLSAANCAVIRESDALLLVMERDPLCIESAKPILQAIRAWKVVPPLIGSVIVNRTPLAVPMDMSEIEMQLGIPALGVIPPAADLCIAAHKAGKPLPLFDPDSIAGHSLVSLAEALVMPGRKPVRAS